MEELASKIGLTHGLERGDMDMLTRPAGPTFSNSSGKY